MGRAEPLPATAAAPATPTAFDLYVQGEIPPSMDGSLIVSTSRRDKVHAVFSRWHDSPTDLIKIDLSPGRPGRARAHVLPVDPCPNDLPGTYDCPPGGYVTQPNHGVNVAGGKVWATNLLFGAPLEVDLATWRPRRVLRYVEPDAAAPMASTTSHFAWSLDGRFAYFHQSLLARETDAEPVRSLDLRLVELEVATGAERVWTVKPPPDDDLPAAANFHSAFYFEEEGKRFLGLLRTGAVVESLFAHREPADHPVVPMPASTIWTVELDPDRSELAAELLPGIRELDGLALSHLDVDNRGGDGFVLYANFKEADIAEETHGTNIYGEPPEAVREHYAGMIVEALRYGQVIRYEKRHGRTDLKVFRRDYDDGRTSLGHTWLPINIELDARREHLFCTFSGFHPRLLPRHLATAYAHRTVDPRRVRYVPPLLLRLNARTLEPDAGRGRDHLSYAEPVALAVVGEVGDGWVSTFSPEVGLRIYRADDLSHMVAHAVSAELEHWQDSHFRPDPAHMVFVPR